MLALGSDQLINSDLGFAFPTHVRLIQDDVFAGNLERNTIPQHDDSLFFASLLDDCNATPQQCNAVALDQSALLLLLGVVPPPQADDVVQPIGIIPAVTLPQPNAFAVPKHEDVGAERNQLKQTCVQLCEREWQQLERQNQTLRVCELSTPSQSVLYDRTPQIDFAADAAIRVAYLPQVLTILRRVNTACAFPMWDFVGSLCRMARSGCNAAPRLKMLPRKPRLAIE
jgi:hypothetical protein